MGDWLRETVLNGSLLLAAPVAFVAGIVSFLSPCVLPLLPGYVSYVTGLSGADLQAPAAMRLRGRLLLGSALFVLGFWFLQQAVFGYFDLAQPTGSGGGVAYFAHIGGFVFGLLAIRVFAKRRKAPPSPFARR